MHGSKNDLFTKCYSTRVKISIETSMIEIKPAVTEKHEFEDRDNTNNTSFENFRSQNYNATIKINDVSTDYSISLRFSIETLMEEILPVVAEKLGVEYRDESVLFALL